MMKVLAVIGLIAIGFYLGWAVAHMTIATECKRLGGFFVGKEIFHCRQIDKREAPEE